MSDYIDMFVEMLPMHSNIQNKNNQLRKVLDKSVGEYMDNMNDILDQVFLTSATGGWLDAHGKDYGVLRKIDESDDDYRKRIIFEKLEYLTAENLQEIYGLTLYCFVSDFDPTDNDLTSDNPYASNRYMSVASDELKSILNNKFIIGDGIVWL